MPTTTARRLTAARKCSRFEICERHAGWFAGTTRYRKAETFVEGGPSMPAGEEGCAGGRCRLWPGRDFYAEEYCYGELELDWTTAGDD